MFYRQGVLQNESTFRTSKHSLSWEFHSESHFFTTLKRSCCLVKRKTIKFSNLCQSNIALNFIFFQNKLLKAKRFRKIMQKTEKTSKTAFFKTHIRSAKCYFFGGPFLQNFKIFLRQFTTKSFFKKSGKKVQKKCK